MKRLALTLALLVCVTSSNARIANGQAVTDSQKPTGQDVQSKPGLDFLEPGEDYVIRFSDGNDIFKISRSEITQATTTDSDGRSKSAGPVAWNYTLSLTVFQVVRLGRGSWVLLRHPNNPDDFMQWARQRQAKAILASGSLEKLGSEANGQERLKRLQDDAKQDIATTETWINLDHAIAIAPVPIEEGKTQLSIKSVKVEPKK